MNLTRKKLERGFCVVVLLLTASLAAAAQKTTSTSTNVTTIVHDYSSDGTTQLLLRSDDYNGAGQATYTSYTSGRSSLGSSINSSGEWVLSLGHQSLRTVWVTPNDAVGSQPAGPPAGYYWDNTNVSSKCFDQYGNIVPLANITTSSGNCKLGVTFVTADGTEYVLLMSPFPFSAPGDIPAKCPSTGCPATGLAAVTCNALNSSGQCVSWSIAPNAGGPNPNVANLYQYTSTKGSSYWLYIGEYHNTFRIDVTNP